MHRPIALSLLCGIVIIGCAMPKPGPLNFPSGEARWSVPLVGALDSDLLVVPVTIGSNDKPYLFVISPDAETSAIDAEVAEENGLFSGGRLHRAGRHIRVRRFHVPRMQVGELAIRSFAAYEAPGGKLRVNGRRIHGILGRNILRQTVSIYVDRDRGRIDFALMTDDAFLMRGRPVQGRSWQKYDARRSLIVPVTVDGQSRELAVDLGAPRTALRDEFLPRKARVHSVAFDEMGRQRIKPLVSAEVRLSYDLRTRLRVTSYGAKEYTSGYDGVLGQDFLRRYRYLYRRESRELWVAPRDLSLAKSAGERLRRFAEFAPCAMAVCTELHTDGKTTQVKAQQSGPKSWVLYLQPSVRAPGAGDDLRRLVVHAGQSYDLRGEWLLVDADPFAPARPTAISPFPTVSARAKSRTKAIRRD